MVLSYVKVLPVKLKLKKPDRLMLDEVGPLTGPRTMVVMVGLLFVTVTLTPGVVRSALSAPGATRHSRLSRQADYSKPLEGKFLCRRHHQEVT